MHRKPVIAANWKLNHGPTDAKAFLQRFLAQSPKLNERTLIFFPSAITLTTVVEGLRERPEIWVGVQNVHGEAQGAFTGENSVLMARDAGARVVLVGHSERRHVFGESDAATTKKMALIAQARLVPMLCVGETLAEREAGRTGLVVERQLAAGLAELDDAQIASIMLAYEPVWAIGTGRTATPEDASEIHGMLRRALVSRVGDKVAAGIPILYGGSVNRGNAPQLLAAADVDGLLVGGASLDPDNWAGIVRA
ncbi:MAG: triose-phosphate isomerase [Gemmatimonas sp.]|jgi:triosephosphate isomerase|uniref:triose-phosphate isomerase n=1 Tax=Gemmatimonas sp. TaxID=1962908 RepID=UPI00391F87D3